MTDAAAIPAEQPLFEIELTAMAHGGSALGRHEKRTIFIPYTLPGERVMARITQERGRVAFAEGVTLLEASADRVYPRCPHFGPGRCGRCQWQHIDYDAQLLLKQDVLNDQLGRIGGLEDALIEAVVQPVLPSPQQWGYNYHMTMVVTATGTPGFLSTDGVTPFIIEECHILHPDLVALLPQLDLDITGLKQLKLQLGSDGAHMVILSIDSEDNVPDLLTDMPTSINLLLPDHQPVNMVGDTHTRYTVGNRTFRVTAGCDFRPNLSQLENLASVVVELLDLTGREAVLDLYGGVGFFSAYIAPHAALVTMIESYPPAVSDAEENLAEFEHIDLIEGTVEDALQSLTVGYQAAVVDPSSDGLSLEVMDALAGLKLPRLVYVSSDPATLARDTKRLLVHGYRLERVQPIDLSPQTYFIDSVALFAYGKQ